MNQEPNQDNDAQLGLQIQAYVKSRWGYHPDGSEAVHLDAGLEEGLKDRIDTLGADGEWLLHVAATQVIAELERLERDAAREDAKGATAAARTQVQQAKPSDDKGPERREPQARHERNREPARHGRRRQRDQH